MHILGEMNTLGSSKSVSPMDGVMEVIVFSFCIIGLNMFRAFVRMHSYIQYENAQPLCSACFCFGYPDWVLCTSTDTSTDQVSDNGESVDLMQVNQETQIDQIDQIDRCHCRILSSVKPRRRTRPTDYGDAG